MKYFKVGLTPEAYKREYLRLCKKLHPDRGGNKKEFIEMRAEYENILTGKIREDTTSKAEINEYRDMLISLIRSQFPEVAFWLNHALDSEFGILIRPFIPKRYMNIINLLTDENNKK